jgi:hypothetical protein
MPYGGTSSRPCIRTDGLQNKCGYHKHGGVCASDVLCVNPALYPKERGVKYDGHKPRYDLIPPEILEALAKVLTYGAQLYGDRNWENGIEYRRLFAACQRHLWADWAGQELDRESGLPHLWHAATNIAMHIALREREKNGRD